MSIVGLISPYRGNVGWNMEQARKWGRAQALSGNVPIIPHLYLTQLLCDDVPEERDRGLALGREMYLLCDLVKVNAWGQFWLGLGISDWLGLGISEGMAGDIEFCKENGIKIVYVTSGILEALEAMEAGQEGEE